ncbi:MAG: TetR/AcrR family transcriptional regulator [Firmicutes bacterium]|nr:TetR/AcrR family transcriptional regulator [Bacillota bacterium]
MPKNTFFNLPEKKRTRILNAAIDEFSKYSYEKASITRIVNTANIAKGSFYQYFENKLDLFRHIFMISADEKLKYLKPTLDKMESEDFFTTLRNLYVAGIEFVKENYKLSQIADRLMKSNNENLKNEIFGETKPKSNHFLKVLLLKGIKRGEIDSSIDVELVSVMLTNLSFTITEYYLKTNEKGIVTDDYSDLMEMVEKMIYTIENGIKIKGEDNNDY